MAVDFEAFDWRQAQLVNRRHLPHLAQSNAIYFVTFRLGDSLPAMIVRRWREDRDRWLIANPPPHSRQQATVLRQLYTGRLHKYLDAGHGECVLRRPAVQDIVEEVLRFGDTHDYGLGEFVIMPNHVHALVQPSAKTIAEFLAKWKSISSRRINRRLNRHGALWQAESFDHIVRDANRLDLARQYIRSNPSGLPAGTYRLGVGSLQ